MTAKLPRMSDVISDLAYRYGHASILEATRNNLRKHADEIREEYPLDAKWCGHAAAELSDAILCAREIEN